jgi:[lysine-biosynthesis-protein LysW]--L-2-aminoadipate ligase
MSRNDKAIGVLYDRIRWEEKQLVRAFREKGIDPYPIDAKTIIEVVTDPSDRLENFPSVILERCISFYRGAFLTSVLENSGLKVINPYKVLNTCGNKLLTTEAFTREKVPTPKTLVAFSPESAIECANKIGYPCVLKPIIGSWGRNVVKLLDEDTARSFIEMRNSNGEGTHQAIFYIQEFVERPPRDIRCVVVGDKLVASVYRYAANGSWKTNVALGGRSENLKLTDEQQEIVLKASRAVGGGVLGIDAMESSDGRFLVHEANGTVEFRGAASASGNDIAKEIVEYAISET